mmetsp:Transcript_107880/g.230378  ORF Transcript_107880/g.230378 Transcript_107880/m.230378 type:complete len:227 (-) Transcript_107880:7-687(-)
MKRLHSEVPGATVSMFQAREHGIDGALIAFLHSLRQHPERDVPHGQICILEARTHNSGDGALISLSCHLGNGFHSRTPDTPIHVVQARAHRIDCSLDTSHSTCLRQSLQRLHLLTRARAILEITQDALHGDEHRHREQARFCLAMLRQGLGVAQDGRADQQLLAHRRHLRDLGHPLLKGCHTALRWQEELEQVTGHIPQSDTQRRSVRGGLLRHGTRPPTPSAQHP